MQNKAERDDAPLTRQELNSANITKLFLAELEYLWGKGGRRVYH